MDIEGVFINFSPSQLANLRLLIQYGEVYAVPVSLDSKVTNNGSYLGCQKPIAICLFHPDLPEQDFLMSINDVQKNIYAWSSMQNILSVLTIMGVEVRYLHAAKDSLTMTNPPTDWRVFDPADCEPVSHLLSVQADTLVKMQENLSGQPQLAPPVWACELSRREDIYEDYKDKACDLILQTSPGDKKIQTIKLVRQITNLGLAEAKAVVDVPGSTIRLRRSLEEVQEIAHQFKLIGATVDIVNGHGKTQRLVARDSDYELR